MRQNAERLKGEGKQASQKPASSNSHRLKEAQLELRGALQRVDFGCGSCDLSRRGSAGSGGRKVRIWEANWRLQGAKDFSARSTNDSF